MLDDQGRSLPIPEPWLHNSQPFPALGGSETPAGTPAAGWCGNPALGGPVCTSDLHGVTSAHVRLQCLEVVRLELETLFSRFSKLALAQKNCSPGWDENRPGREALTFLLLSPCPPTHS